jgi:Uma2 family endonuclease
VQSPVYLDEATEPLPDLTVLKFKDYLHLGKHEQPEDICLIVEVADSSVRSDRNRKMPRYARAGIPEVWLVNIPRKVVEVYSDPVAGKYQNTERVGKGQTLTLKSFPDVTIAVDSFLI